MKGYRFVTEDLKSENGEVQWRIGEWQKLDNKKPLKLCDNGLRASRQPIDSLTYVLGCRWFKCEARGEIKEDTDKFCAREMRLTKEIPVTIIKTFAVACAKHVLPLYEKKYPEDKRPRKAIETAEIYLKNPTIKNHEKAMRHAWDAAWAAWDAARAAAAAAWAAAWDAARAARAAAWAKEKRWQNRLLKKLIKEA